MSRSMARQGASRDVLAKSSARLGRSNLFSDHLVKMKVWYRLLFSRPYQALPCHSSTVRTIRCNIIRSTSLVVPHTTRSRTVVTRTVFLTWLERNSQTFPTQDCQRLLLLRLDVIELPAIHYAIGISKASQLIVSQITAFVISEWSLRRENRPHTVCTNRCVPYSMLSHA